MKNKILLASAVQAFVLMIIIAFLSCSSLVKVVFALAWMTSFMTMLVLEYCRKSNIQRQKRRQNRAFAKQQGKNDFFKNMSL